MPIPDDAPASHDALPGIRSPAAAPRVIGHEAAEQALAAAFGAGRPHHAWLIQGPRGIGKATLAFAFARQTLAGVGRPGADSAEDVARQVAIGSHPGLIHVERPPNERGGFKTQVTVDEIRRLNHFFHTTSGGRGWRVAVVDPVDDLNRNAANALLKLLEEPPSRSLFLLVNHLPGRLLPTIRSRCRVLRCEALGSDAVGAVLADLGLDAEPDAIAAAVRQSGGSVREAIQRVSGEGHAIEQRLDAVLAASDPDWHAISALADGLTQRDRETDFNLVVASLFTRLAQESEERLVGNDLGGANARARLWSEEETRFRDGLQYNMDRKQLLMTHFQRRFAMRNAPSENR